MKILLRIYEIIAFYFFIFVPVAYVLNYWGLELSVLVFILQALLICLIVYITSHLRAIISGLFRHKALLAGLLIFLALQGLFYYFYFTIPEWDGYAVILQIEQQLKASSLISAYRPFFPASITLISAATKLDPYFVFTIIFVPLQALLVVSGYLLAFKRISKPLNSLFWILLFFSIPVLNMEIGIVRAQTLLIIGLALYAAFLSNSYPASLNKKKIINFIISFVGLFYHELFIFLLLHYFINLVKTQVGKFLNPKSKLTDKQISLLVLSTALFMTLYALEIIPTLGFLKLSVINLLGRITDFHNWTLWYLNNYGSDGINIGWNGIFELSQFYSYYLSPTLLFLLIIMLVGKCKSFADLFSNSYFWVALLCFSLAEIFPRLGYYYLPERMWLIFVLFFIFSIFTNEKCIKCLNNLSKLTVVVLIFSEILGIIGSIYVSYAKKSLTSKPEYEAALWIKNNTPPTAQFFSQKANLPMITYFGRRQLLPESDYFFLGRTIQLVEPVAASQEVQTEELLLKNIREFDYYKGDLNLFNKNIGILRSIQRSSTIGSSVVDKSDIYILYSFQKFNSIYSGRQWWKEVNYFGLDLSKFSKYELVYSKDGVYIWKI
ncbi:hypothetical protein A2397_05110 [Candidatus Amesbacteria bacterium RIFOXYB1_FULL_44_23]|uniref:Glycosyltransferase RgtA/B/C/D-like domain-containing protein n=1 Tax=Candidatus Amesbacteria bacterium RIFOXYB1_FULL_44_23 TaxID=1797263 RepID=A0A1F4ZT02_9BACT|nr:MAG: hypothetical protein A2397_05110 [Candidatus Amesbacteria bacterium RIFOXYB1_FULL_44_23]